MAIIVQKYGGSSVAHVEKLHQVAQAVAARVGAGDSVVVVVSAMGKTTDALLAQAAQVMQNPPQRELDMLVTAGERVSMALLSMAMHKAGLDSISFTGSQSGIITENTHQGARIVEVRPYRIQDELERGKVVIVAGFQGVSLEREITTLGRGGSDTTAVAMAAALGAEACEIYSDVDGVYDADPNVCPQAHLLTQLNYETMQHMAAAGARVLNAQAVEFARRAGIQIIARKTSDKSGRETCVSEFSEAVAGHVHAVIGVARATLLQGTILEMGSLVSQIETLGGTVLSANQHECLVSEGNLVHPGSTVFAGLATQYGLEACRASALTVIGAGLLERVSQVEKILRDQQLKFRIVSAVDGALVVCLDASMSEKAVQLLHASLCSGN